MNKYREENLEIKSNLKFAVQVVILNEEGKVLAVSRKDNHEDFGLVGGKVDPEDASLEDALIRETKEETGLTICKEDLTQVFSMYKDGYMGYTYLCEKFEGEVNSDEPHIIKWTEFEEVCFGSFGKWNYMVADSLHNMGINFKYFIPMVASNDVPSNEYVFSIEEDEDEGEGFLFYVAPKYDEEGEGKWAYYDRNSDNMEDEISEILNKVKVEVDYLDEATMKLFDQNDLNMVISEEEVCFFLTEAGLKRDKFNI